MRVTTYEGNNTRKILAGMIQDDVVCNRVAGQWPEDGLFDSPWANLVGAWCVKYVRKYNKAPGSNIRAIFDQWADTTTTDEKTIDTIEDFLVAISDESQDEPLASDYILDLAANYFNKIRIQTAMEVATAEIDRGKVQEAKHHLTNLQNVELGIGSLIKPVEDFPLWEESFNQEREPSMLSYSGGLEKFFKDMTGRDTLLSFMAPDKSGKSYWLLDIAFRALRNRRRVAYFEAGDLSLDDVIVRMGHRAARLPRTPKSLRIPTSIDGSGAVVYENRLYREAITAGVAYKAFKKLCRGKDMMRLSVHSNSTLSTDNISSVLGDWEREGWIPDVVIVDYIDIMAPPIGETDEIHRRDHNWKHLRRISQDYHCLLVTASQASALAYGNNTDAQVLTKRHFSGRKTIFAHTNGVIGINQTNEEKENQVYRLNWIVRRKGNYTERQVCRVAGCLDLASPAICSYF